MTVRTPVYWDGSAVREMSADNITAVINRCLMLHSPAPATDLNYVSASGDLPRMLDTRDRAGAESSPADAFTTPGAATDATASTTRDHIDQTINAGTEFADTDNLQYPLYKDGNSLRAMTRDDFKDTFIKPAIELLVDGNDRDGTYKLVQSATANGNTVGHIRVSGSPVFIDTRFDAIGIHGGLTASGQPHTVTFLPLSSIDQPDDGADRKWYLWKGSSVTANSGVNVSVTPPLRALSDGSLKSMSSGEFDLLLQGLLQYTAGSSGDTGYRIRYHIKNNGPGDPGFGVSDPSWVEYANKGEAVVDTTLDSDVEVREETDVNNYRSQNLPTGSEQTETSYNLVIYRI